MDIDVELAAYEKGLGKLYENLPKYVHGGDASDKSSNIWYVWNTYNSFW